MPGTEQADAVSWAMAIIHRTDVLYLDTETTGLGNTDEIVEIAILDNAGRILLDTLVKPHATIPAAATAIHRITDQLVRDAPTWPEIYPRLSRLLAAYPHAVVYNADFDRRLIAQSCGSHRLMPPVARWHCAMKQYAAFAGERSPHFGDFRWFRLDQAALRCGVAMMPNHRALSDARTCRAVVHAMAGQTAS